MVMSGLQSMWRRAFRTWTPTHLASLVCAMGAAGCTPGAAAAEVADVAAAWAACGEAPDEVPPCARAMRAPDDAIAWTPFVVRAYAGAASRACVLRVTCPAGGRVDLEDCADGQLGAPGPRGCLAECYTDFATCAEGPDGLCLDKTALRACVERVAACEARCTQDA